MMPSHEDYIRDCREKQRMFCLHLEELAMDILRDGNVKASNQIVDLMMECRLMDPERFDQYKLPTSRASACAGGTDV